MPKFKMHDFVFVSACDVEKGVPLKVCDKDGGMFVLISQARIDTALDEIMEELGPDEDVKIVLGGLYRHKKSGVVLAMMAGDTEEDEYRLVQKIERGLIQMSWYGNYRQLNEQFYEVENG